MPRPGPRSPTICLRLPPASLAHVEEVAKANRTTRSATIRALLDKALDVEEMAEALRLTGEGA